MAPGGDGRNAVCVKVGNWALGEVSLQQREWDCTVLQQGFRIQAQRTETFLTLFSMRLCFSADGKTIVMCKVGEHDEEREYDDYDVGSLRDKSERILLVASCEVLFTDWELFGRRHGRSLRDVSKVDDLHPEWMGYTIPQSRSGGLRSFQRVCFPVSPCCTLCSRIVYQKV